MTHSHRSLEYRRFSAPREDRAALVDPPWEQVGGLIAANVEGKKLLAACQLQGRSLAELAAAARADLLAQARQWTAAYRPVEPAAEDPRGLILLAGHQPELFHPGVWFKNFALGSLALRYRATAVNLVIDSDTVKSASLPVPGGTLEAPRREAIALDRPEPLVPYEERRVVDGELLADFGRRAAEQMACLVSHPLLGDFWPMVLQRRRHTDRLGYCLAQARHQIEGRWGLRTLEVPQSWVCQSEPFRWFVMHLAAEAGRFREVHNQVVGEYRRNNRIRSAAHPVPDLLQDAAWIELPLWVWTAESPQRRRLFVRQEGGGLVMSDRQGLERRFPWGRPPDAAAAVEALADWSRRGVRIRSRALVTTLWARLALGDLFVHGIGGAKYDQVTDRLIERFFGLRPPGILVLSATLYLPVAVPRDAAAEARALRGALRDLVFHPELVNDPPLPREARELVAAKRRWLATPQTPANARQRWQSLREINAALQPWVAQHRRRLLDRQAAVLHALRVERVLGWREYGFCLYPEKTLREFLEQLLPKNA
jgi:hypothetical protein